MKKKDKIKVYDTDYIKTIDNYLNFENENFKTKNKAGLLLALQINRSDIVNFRKSKKKSIKKFLYEYENANLKLENWILENSFYKQNNKYNTNNLFNYWNIAFRYENLEAEKQSDNNINTDKIIINIEKSREIN